MSLLLPGLAFITGVAWAALDHLAGSAMLLSNLVPRPAGLQLASLLGLALVTCIAAYGPVMLVWRSDSRGRVVPTAPTAALLPAVALALLAGRVHAGLAFTGPVEAGWSRGVGVIDLVIEGASEPGGRCTVQASPYGGNPSHFRGRGLIEVDLPAEACPLAQGDIVGIPSVALRRVPTPPPWLESAGSKSFGDRVRLRADLWFRRGLDGGGASAWARGYWLAIARSRQGLLDAARGDLARGLVVASTLGQRGALPEAATDSLRRAGLWHIVSVSGLHVAVASLLVLALGLRLCAIAELHVTWAVLGGWALVATYVVLTGASAPAVRAGLMSAWFGLGILLGRPAHGLTTLVMALTTMLLFRPTWIVEPGFQLSAVAMAALVTAEREAGIVAQSWRLTWALAPLCLWWFEGLSLVGVLLNVVAVPVFTIVVLPAGLIGGALVPWWGGSALDVSAAGARLVLDLAALAARLPPAGTHATAGLAAVLLAFTAYSRARRRSRTFGTRTTVEPQAMQRVRRLGDALASAPMIALVAVVLVAWGRLPATPVVHDGVSSRIYAIGDASHRALLLARPGGGTCIDVSRAASLPWARWLVALGMPKPWIVIGGDPISVAVRARLDAQLDDGRCAPAMAIAIAEGRRTGIGGTLRSCRRLGMEGPVIVRTERVTGRWSCAMSAGWKAIP